MPGKKTGVPAEIPNPDRYPEIKPVTTPDEPLIYPDHEADEDPEIEPDREPHRPIPAEPPAPEIKPHGV